MSHLDMYDRCHILLIATTTLLPGLYVYYRRKRCEGKLGKLSNILDLLASNVFSLYHVHMLFEKISRRKGSLLL